MYLINVGGSYKILPDFSIALALRGEFRDRFWRDNHIRVKSSCSKVVYANLSFSWKINREMSFITGIMLPVYRYMNGIQLGNTLGVYSVFTLKY